LHSLHRAADDALVATAEQLYLHVSTEAGKVAPMDAQVRARLVAIQAATR
jgi:acyl-CoA thioesterase FadM